LTNHEISVLESGTEADRSYRSTERGFESP